MTRERKSIVLMNAVRANHALETANYIGGSLDGVGIGTCHTKHELSPGFANAVWLHLIKKHKIAEAGDEMMEMGVTWDELEEIRDEMLQIKDTKRFGVKVRLCENYIKLAS